MEGAHLVLRRMAIDRVDEPALADFERADMVAVAILAAAECLYTPLGG